MISWKRVRKKRIKKIVSLWTICCLAFRENILSNRKLFANPTVNMWEMKQQSWKIFWKEKPQKDFQFMLWISVNWIRGECIHIWHFIWIQGKGIRHHKIPSRIFFSPNNLVLCFDFLTRFFYMETWQITFHDFRSDRDGPTSLLSGSWTIPHRNVR